MSTKEFSDSFDTLVNSYRRFRDFDNMEALDTIDFNEYEKSVYLSKAQLEIVISLYNGKNPYGDSFERTEEMRRYLDPLVRTVVLSRESSGDPVSSNSVFFDLPDDIAFITMEQVTYRKPGTCWDGKRVGVVPASQDEFDRRRRNPFRGPTDYRVLRLDAGEGVCELVSKHPIGTYMLRYLSRPEPIVLEDLPEGLSIEGESMEHDCKLNSVLHQPILERAVMLAMNSRSIKTNSTN